MYIFSVFLKYYCLAILFVMCTYSTQNIILWGVIYLPGYLTTFNINSTSLHFIFILSFSTLLVYLWV